MNIKGEPWQAIWLETSGNSFGVIDQNELPHLLKTRSIKTCDEAVKAIKTMVVRGAPLIGVTGAYGLMLALKVDQSNSSLEQAYKALLATRPTAINLLWALDRVRSKVEHLPLSKRVEVARQEAQLIALEDIKACESIGNHGLTLFKKLQAFKDKKGLAGPLNILTHCNAGWLATVDWGTALAPIYKAHREGMKIHVWVDETRPRNQGSSLTAFELAAEGIPHTVIVDNAGGHLMQHGKVDAVIVGSDRTTSKGDVCNKIGTYLKALAAFDNKIPFYVAIPMSTIDWEISDGLDSIPIEIRSEEEVTHIKGLSNKDDGLLKIETVQLAPSGCKGFNPAFDVTPSRLVTRIITEYGSSKPNKEDLMSLLT